MTDKRFKIEWIEEEMYPMPIYYDDGDKKLSYDKVCELLNELYEANMILKGEVAHYKLILMSLEEQAKRLSYEVKDNLHILDCGGFAIEYSAKKCCEELNNLHEENEQLKSFNQDLSENLSVCADKRLAQGEHLTKLNNENEQLKKQNKRLEYKIQRERNSTHKQYAKWEKEAENKIKELSEENEQLKELLDYADDLIQSHLSEHFIRQWRNFKTGHKEYNDFWEEKIKKHNELKCDVNEKELE